MNKLNKELIEAKKKIVKLEKKIKSMDKKKRLLQDKIHLYFDSELHNTTDAEDFIVNYYWQHDATYSSEFYTSPIKQQYTKDMLSKIVKKSEVSTKRAMDAGCGNGMYTEHLASIFDDVVGLDLSKQRIERNIAANKFENITYMSENFITCEDEKLGKFDFIFASDLNMYTSKRYLRSIFESLIGLLNDNGVLLMRESITLKGEREYKSYRYVAHYRNKEFYKQGIYKKHFVKSYRDASYNLPHLNKYFSIFPKDYKKIEKRPLKLDKIVKNYISDDTPSCYYYVYKK